MYNMRLTCKINEILLLASVIFYLFLEAKHQQFHSSKIYQRSNKVLAGARSFLELIEKNEKNG